MNDAIQLMQEEIAKHPEEKNLRLYRANFLVRKEQYEAAISEYGQLLAAEKTPKERASLLFKLGEAYRRKGDLKEALRQFEAAAKANPDGVDALLEQALLLDGTGHQDEARVVYEHVLKLAPNDAVALNNLAYIKASEGLDLDSALALAQKAAAAAKDSPEIQDTLGEAYLKKNQPDQAIEAFRAALQAQPNNGTFHYHLALALLPIGERDAAIQELKTALADQPHPQDEPEIRKLLAKLTD
jgi:Flp pilus assembly protein TadD